MLLSVGPTVNAEALRVYTKIQTGEHDAFQTWTGRRQQTVGRRPIDPATQFLEPGQCWRWGEKIAPIVDVLAYLGDDRVALQPEPTCRVMSRSDADRPPFNAKPSTMAWGFYGGRRSI